MQELSQPVRDSKVICRSFCQKPWKRLHEQSHNSNQDLTKMAEAPYAPWRGTHGGCTYATRQSLEKASKEVVVITKCDHPILFFFFNCRETSDSNDALCGHVGRDFYSTIHRWDQHTIMRGKKSVRTRTGSHLSAFAPEPARSLFLPLLSHFL